MPTLHLVWTHRSESGTSAASAGGREVFPDAVVSDSAISAVPDQAVSSGAALPASKQHVDEGKKIKRKKIRAEAAKAVKKKKSKASSERGLPMGVYKLPSGKFQSKMRWGGKERHIGCFDTPEQASAAFMSVRRDRDRASLSVVGADDVDALFYAARKKAVEVMGGCVPEKRELPQGVCKVRSGKFQARIKWGDKNRCIGLFDTSEHASTAYMSIKKDLDAVNLSAVSSDEVDAAFNTAKRKVLKSFGGFPERRELPRGARKTSSGKFQARITLCGKMRYIGSSFDTPEQASAAYMSMKKDLDAAKLSAFGADKVDAIFNAAKKEALEKAEAMKESDKYGDEFLV